MSMTTGTTGLTADEARAIAREAWLYAYAPLQGYQTMYSQTQDKAFGGYVASLLQNEGRKRPAM